MYRMMVLAFLIGVCVGCAGMSVDGSEKRLTIIIDEQSGARILVPPDQSIRAERVPCFDDEWETCLALSCVEPQPTVEEEQ